MDYLQLFHGDGPQLETYKKYCQDNGFANVEFTGAYDNNSKEKLLKDAHILNNCYGYEKGAGNKLKHAVSNRFYDGLIFHIPQLVEPDGYKSKWVISSEVGVNFQVDEKFADKLYQYYHAIDVDKFNNACKIELQKIIHEDDEYINNIDAFIKNEHVKGQI